MLYLKKIFILLPYYIYNEVISIGKTSQSLQTQECRLISVWALDLLVFVFLYLWKLCKIDALASLHIFYIVNLDTNLEWHFTFLAFSLVASSNVQIMLKPNVDNMRAMAHFSQVLFEKDVLTST